MGKLANFGLGHGFNSYICNTLPEGSITMVPMAIEIVDSLTMIENGNFM